MSDSGTYMSVEFRELFPDKFESDFYSLEKSSVEFGTFWYLSYGCNEKSYGDL